MNIEQEAKQMMEEAPVWIEHGLKTDTLTKRRVPTV